jgi:hypothetical protein
MRIHVRYTLAHVLHLCAVLNVRSLCQRATLWTLRDEVSFAINSLSRARATVSALAQTQNMISLLTCIHAQMHKNRESARARAHE